MHTIYSSINRGLPQAFIYILFAFLQLFFLCVADTQVPSVTQVLMPRV